MISVHLLSQEEVEKQLTAIGCEAIESPLPEHSAWRSPWGNVFLVPQVGDEGRTAMWVLDKVINEVHESKPQCN